METGKSSAGVNHAVESGDIYYVKIESRYGDDAETPEAEEANGSQDYELDVESVALDTNEPNDDAANATDFSTGVTASTNILRTESDRYAVELEDGENVTVTYEVTARINHEGAAMPTKTTVVNPSGEEVAGSEPIDDEGPDNVSYTFTANESGTYLVTATANTDEMTVSGVRGNDLTQYDLRLDVNESSQDGGEQTATPTATPPTDDPSGEDDSNQDGQQDDVESDGAPYSGGDQSAGDDADDDSGTRTATSEPTPTATSETTTSTTTGTSASTSSGTEAPTQTAAPAESTGTERATQAPGLPGFGVGVAIVGVFVATLMAIRLRRRPGP